MNIQENKELIRRFVEEIWNRHELDRFDEFVGGDQAAEFSEHTRQFMTAFPDVTITIEDLIAEGDKVAGRLVVNGTNTGPFAGQPPTGGKIHFGSFRFYQIAGGRIVKTWAMQDRLSLMEQLGSVQSTGGVNWAAGQENSEITRV